jgi:hypothetical protein
MLIYVSIFSSSLIDVNFLVECSYGQMGTACQFHLNFINYSCCVRLIIMPSAWLFIVAFIVIIVQMT